MWFHDNNYAAISAQLFLTAPWNTCVCLWPIQPSRCFRNQMFFHDKAPTVDDHSTFVNSWIMSSLNASNLFCIISNYHFAFHFIRETIAKFAQLSTTCFRQDWYYRIGVLPTIFDTIHSKNVLYKWKKSLEEYCVVIIVGLNSLFFPMYQVQYDQSDRFSCLAASTKVTVLRWKVNPCFYRILL